MDLEGRVWTNWRTTPPPRSTVVRGHYGDDRPSMVGRTCRSGCCWNPNGIGPCVIPLWWTAANDPTPSDGTGESNG